MLRLYIVISFILGSTITSFAQDLSNGEISGLRDKLKTSKDDTSKVNTLDKMGAWYFKRGSINRKYVDSALLTQIQAEQLSTRLHYATGYQTALASLAMLYFSTNDTTTALVKMQLLADTNKIKVLSQVGILYGERSPTAKENLDTAMRYFFLQ